MASMSQGGPYQLDFIPCDHVHPNLEKLCHSAAISGSHEPLLCVSCACQVVYPACFLRNCVKSIYRVKPILSVSLMDTESPRPLLLVKQSEYCSVKKI